MAIKGGRVAVGLTPTYIDGTDIQPMTIIVHNDDSNSDIWLGGSDVAVNGGLLLNKLENIALDLRPGNYLYAVATKDPHYVSFLTQRF